MYVNIQDKIKINQSKKILKGYEIRNLLTNKICRNKLKKWKIKGVNVFKSIKEDIKILHGFKKKTSTKNYINIESTSSIHHFKIRTNKEEGLVQITTRGDHLQK